MSRTFRRMPLALITTILTVLLLFSCLLGLKLGYLSVSLSGIVSILASHLLGSALPSDIAMGIADAVWDLRLPRILLALSVGMGLSLSGMVMQAMLRNPMSDPYIMGVSSGASLGRLLPFSLARERLSGYLRSDAGHFSVPWRCHSFSPSRQAAWHRVIHPIS